MQRIKLIAVFFALALFTYLNSVRATDFYVDNVSGDDRNNGLGTITQIINGAAPFRTISRALKAADGGDRIFVINNEGKPYRESITLQGRNHSGNDFQAFQLISEGAIIDGSIPVPAKSWRHFYANVFKFRPEHPSNQILFLNGRPLEEIQANNRSTLEKLKPLQWAIFDSEIYVCLEKAKLPEAYELHICGATVGITLYQVRDAIVSGFIVQGFRNDGLNAHDLVSESVVSRCTFRGNGRSGISVGGASRLKIKESLIGNNRSTQLRTEGFSRTELDDCDLVESETATRIEMDGGKLKINGNVQKSSLK